MYQSLLAATKRSLHKVKERLAARKQSDGSPLPPIFEARASFGTRVNHAAHVERAWHAVSCMLGGPWKFRPLLEDRRPQHGCEWVCIKNERPPLGDDVFSCMFERRVRFGGHPNAKTERLSDDVR